MGRCDVQGECTPGCRSRQHGAQITAAIIRGTEAQAIAYIKNLCQRCHSVTDATGKTALHTAASCGKRKVVKWLVSQGASLNQRDWESGYTPLHRAVFYGHLDTACTLILAGSSTTTLDTEGLTPLDHLNFDRRRSIAFTWALPTHVYLWGNNTNFNLGQTNQHARGTPECLDAFQREGHKVIDVVLNKFHTLFLTSEGRVYTCGHGQGGRLGLDTSAPVITPRPVKAFTHTNVVKVASGTHHSLFLTDAGQVLSCGSNIYHQLGLVPPPEDMHVYTPKVLAWHKDHKDTVITGIDAAKYHSVIWTPQALYTFGLNAGQLGHFRNLNECTVITPRNVTGIVLKESGSLTCVGVSDGATVLATSHGAIYVLHQYQIRKVASKMLGVLKVACIGGHLDSKVGDKGLIEHGGDDLRIGVLTGGGARHLYLWREQSSHLSRCTFSISREICVTDFCMSSQCLGIVTNNGEAFTGIILPTRIQKGTEKPALRKSLWTLGKVIDTYYTTSCVTLRLTRIPALHRTLSIMCDPKGLNFAALQNEPCGFLSDVPPVSPSTRRDNFKTLLDNACESDPIHDVVIICGKRRFPTHAYILATHSQFFRRVLFQGATNANVPGYQNASNTQNEPEKKCIHLSDVPPEALQEVLNFMYTGSSKPSLVAAPCHQNINGTHVTTSATTDRDPHRNSSKKAASSANKENEDMKATEKTKRRKRKSSSGPSDLSQTILYLARRLEVPTLEKALANCKAGIGADEDGDVSVVMCDDSVVYRRESLAELWDVTVTSKSGDAIRGHKCVLAARLEYFNIMFGSRWMGTVASESIQMPLPTGILNIILDFLYEDDCPRLKQCHDVEFLCNVLVVADQFLVTRLREMCERSIAGLLTLKNAAELLEFAVSYNAVGLKTTIMQFLCQNLVAVLENGSLLSSVSQENLQELSEHYRRVNERMSYRIITPHQAPPSAQDLQHALNDTPLILPESDEDMDCELVFKEDKSTMSRNTPGSAHKKKKRQHRNSQGDGRHRKASTSSSVCSSDCDQKDLEEEFENMSFDDLEERKTSPVRETIEQDKRKVEVPDLPNNLMKDNGELGQSSWQKVSRKKSSSSQSVSAKSPVQSVSAKSPVQSMPAKSPVQSPVQDITALHFPSPTTSVPQHNTQDMQVSSVVRESPPPPKFPSLQDSLSTLHKTSHNARNSKIQKLSQKQRKKLVSETAKSRSSPEKAKPSACPWAPPPPAWDTGVEDVCNDTTATTTTAAAAAAATTATTSSLADIMLAEKTKLDERSVPIPVQSRKNQTRPRNSGTPSNSFQDQESTAWSAVAPSPPPCSSQPQHRHSSQHVSAAQDVNAAPSFTHILMEEETRSDNLMRELSKPLSVIQVEDRAIEELLAFYGAGECFEERITVCRVRGSLANPTWNK